MNLFNSVFTEAAEDYDVNSINGSNTLTHLFRACFSESSDENVAWSVLTQVCVDRALAQGKPAYQGFLRAWILFEHHVCIKPVDWIGVDECDEDGVQITPDIVQEIRDSVADLLIQDFVRLYNNGDTEALRAYGDHSSTPSYGELWEFIDSRRDTKIENSKRLIALLGRDAGEWMNEIKKIMNEPCTITVRNHDIVVQAKYAARETIQ